MVKCIRFYWWWLWWIFGIKYDNWKLLQKKKKTISEPTYTIFNVHRNCVYKGLALSKFAKKYKSSNLLNLHYTIRVWHQENVYCTFFPKFRHFKLNCYLIRMLKTTQHFFALKKNYNLPLIYFLILSAEDLPPFLQ